MANFTQFAVRDLGVLGGTLLLWWLDNRDLDVLTGLMSGLCALLFHEWGHLFGAWRCQAKVRPAPNLLLPFLFDLGATNSSNQFVTTSLWGFYATGVFLLFFYLVLPVNHAASTVTWWVSGVLASLTVVIEFPIAWRVYRGHAIPTVKIYNRGDEWN